MTLENLFDYLWTDYTKETPSAQTIKDLFENNGDTVLNDHIAFRTFNHPSISKEVLATQFINLGYEIAGDYHFEDKKLNAIHLAHPTRTEMPLVFISELLLEEFDTEVQNIIRREVIEVMEAKMNLNENIIFAGRPWFLPSYDTYQTLRKHSEYAAWTYVHGFRANHFTVSVNNLTKFNSIEEVNQFLKDNGHTMNTSGGEVKGTKEVFLKQSSTIAELVDFAFIEGIYQIPTCFYEFAERFEQPNGELFNGFIADNANKIFESTDLAAHETVPA